jgi:protein-disulfide isomerase
MIGVRFVVLAGSCLVSPGSVCAQSVTTQSAVSFTTTSAAAEVTSPVLFETDISKDVAFGSKSARVVMIEYTDMQCPFCAQYFRSAFNRILADYVLSRKVLYVYRDFPLPSHPNAFLAAKANRCAAAVGKYRQMHDRLLMSQASLEKEDLIHDAENIGIAPELFKNCLANDRVTSEIREIVRDGDRYGVTATPSFMIGRVVPGTTKVQIVQVVKGAKPYKQFAQILDLTLATSD